MTALYFRVLLATAVSLSALMAGVWVVRQRTFSLGPVGAASALWPIGDAAPNARQWLATLLAPVFMYRIPAYVIGIPPLEAQMLRSRVDRYRDYRSRTGRLFLLPQKGAVT